jgi:hypothetical protein
MVCVTRGVRINFCLRRRGVLLIIDLVFSMI